jgi:putative sporulation protein YyaC
MIQNIETAKEPLRKPLFSGMSNEENRAKFAQTLSTLIQGETVFVCIGCTLLGGDSIGPSIGSRLESKGFNVLGTLANPVNALNLREKIRAIKETKNVIAIDASVSHRNPIGNVSIYDRPLKPGAGVGKTLPWVGNCSISIIMSADALDSMLNMLSLKMVPRSFVDEKSQYVADFIETAFMLNNSYQVAVN